MYETIQPISGEPVYKAVLERFTHVTVDVTNTKSVAKQLVVFVATDKSDIIKLAILPRYDGACVVEIWNLKDAKGGMIIKTMQFVKDTVRFKYLLNYNLFFEMTYLQLTSRVATATTDFWASGVFSQSLNFLLLP